MYHKVFFKQWDHFKGVSPHGLCKELIEFLYYSSPDRLVVIIHRDIYHTYNVHKGQQPVNLNQDLNRDVTEFGMDRVC
jgi:hypothetical protein